MEIDDDLTGFSQGNQNNRVEPGERIELLLGIENHGKGPAKAVQIIMSTKAKNVILEKKESSLGNLPVLGKGEGKFVFYVNGLYQQQKLPLHFRLKEKTGIHRKTFSVSLNVLLSKSSTRISENFNLIPREGNLCILMQKKLEPCR